MKKLKKINPYNENYYKQYYIAPLTNRIKLNNIYLLYLALFCLKIPAKLTKKSKTLDVGCGVGSLVWALRRLGIKSFGIEPSIAAKKFSKAPKFCMYKKYKKLPFKDNTFDLVYTRDVLEHVESSQVESFIKECLRVSKGTLINMICVKEKGELAYRDKTHMTVEPEAWWKKKFNKFGLKVTVGNKFYFFPILSEILKGRFDLMKKGYFYATINKNKIK